MLVVLTTVPNGDQGRSLAGKIVDGNLAACVQILPKMTSVYFWKGEVQTEDEHLLLIKTTKEKYAELEKFIIENHSYDVPEIVAIKAAHVSKPYNAWLNGVVNGKR